MGTDAPQGATASSVHDPVAVIAQSPFFSASWYRQTYPDVDPSGYDPVRHYLNFGAQIGRDPGPHFSTRGYLALHVDVAQAGHNPLWHYELFGRDENRALPARTPQEDALSRSLRASQIDRARIATDPQAARDRLDALFAAPLDGPPARMMADFDAARAERFIADLMAQNDHELAARGRKASVILPTWNRADQLQQAINSVLGQSHLNFELIIVDDGSTDGTEETVAPYTSDRRVHYHRTPHQGVSAARNVGLTQATGDVIFYLDSDNTWTRDHLRIMLTGLAASGATCAYAGLVMRDLKDQVDGYRGEPFDWQACLAGNYIDLNVFCHTRELLATYGAFDPTLRRMVDWDLVLRYTKDHRPVFLPYLGCLYRHDPSDLTRVSTSRPYAYHRVVTEKARHGESAATQTIARMPFHIAVRHTAGDSADGLVAALRGLGHDVRCDGQEDWTARHPHEDDLVVIADREARAIPPHQEQITIALAETPQDAAALTAENRYQAVIERPANPTGAEDAKAAQAIIAQARAALLGKDTPESR